VVVGTSGLTDQDYAEIDTFARERQRGVLACGNFALTVVLLQKFAETAAKLIPQWEIFDYAHDDKVDAPSGTVRELVSRLAKVASPQPTIPLDQTVGPKEVRGATMSGSQVHSVRLPGFVISAEIIFGMPDQKLTIRHDSARCQVLSASTADSTPCLIFRLAGSALHRCDRRRLRCRTRLADQLDGR
jgi:4-hydroxy-tetrahydrodipicolinate reductase